MKDINTFTETEIQRPFLKHMKRYSTILVVKEIHIKLIGNSIPGKTV